MRLMLKIGLIVLLLTMTCCSVPTTEDNHEPDRLLFNIGGYPYITQYKGTYYFLMQAPPPNTITIYSTTEIDSIGKNEGVTIWDGNVHGMYNIWSPELHRINNKWYVYFEADDKNTDNHQLYVLENTSETPLTGEWTLHGPILNNNEWNYGIHPSSIVIGSRQYLLWSGWEHRRTETEVQCIFIAEMENPWTLKTSRTLISRPQYEWERQWINPDGTRTAYPIFVNENPEPFLSPDGKNVIVAYSASGIWTPYNTFGILHAPANCNLLDASVWEKDEEPKFILSNRKDGIFGISNISVITYPGEKKSDMVYQGRDTKNNREESRVYYKSIEWDDASLPIFGFPH